jgi:2-polyprenyl-3-methyl-5-hydroxy-6-metoxy-1,4-benzoquinol methylase
MASSALEKNTETNHMNAELNIQKQPISKTDAAFWNDNWNNNDIHIIKITKISPRQIELIRYLRMLKFSNNRRILEVGIGPGIKLFEVAMMLDLDPWGLDISEIACDLAMKNAKANNIRATIFHGDIFSHAFNNQHFSIVMTQGVIEHFTNPALVLSACSRIVSPNGYLVTTVPNIAGFYGSWLRRNNKELFEKHVPITMKDLRKMYDSIGFEIVVSVPLGGVCIPYYSKVDGFIKWLFIGIFRKTLPYIWGILKFKSEYWAPELLVIGQKKNR